MAKYWVLLIVLAAGLLQPFQVAMNAKLDKVAGSPAVAAFVSFAGGLLVISLLWAFGVFGRGHPGQLAQTPWWAWLTGLVGVVIVISGLIALPLSSAALVIALTVLGQALASLVIDHYGWLDVKRTPINVWRIAGAALILGGTLLMQKK